MKQPEQWEGGEENQKAKPSATPVRKTLPCRVAWLRRWQNKFTGETCEQTTAEFSRSKGILQKYAAEMTQESKMHPSGWLHRERIKKVIQGNAVEFVAMRRVRGGNNSLQAKETISKAWDHSLLILARYANGEGIKPIARSLKIQSRSVWLVLIQSGINTSQRANYQRKELRSLTGPARTYERIKANPSLKLKKRIMGRIWCALKNQKVNERGHFGLIGCSVEELKTHLEKQFQPGMTFENYGAWHVDHIRPCASFDLQDPKQAAECFNWRNLQPLWAADNIRKSDSYARA